MQRSLATALIDRNRACTVESDRELNHSVNSRTVTGGRLSPLQVPPSVTATSRFTAVTSALACKTTNRGLFSDSECGQRLMFCQHTNRYAHPTSNRTWTQSSYPSFAALARKHWCKFQMDSLVAKQNWLTNATESSHCCRANPASPRGVEAARTRASHSSHKPKCGHCRKERCN